MRPYGLESGGCCYEDVERRIGSARMPAYRLENAPMCYELCGCKECQRAPMRRTVMRIKTSAAAAAAAAAAPVKNASKAVRKSLQDSGIAVADLACASVVGKRWQKLSAVTVAPGGGLSDGCTDKQAFEKELRQLHASFKQQQAAAASSQPGAAAPKEPDLIRAMFKAADSYAARLADFVSNSLLRNHAGHQVRQLVIKQVLRPALYKRFRFHTHYWVNCYDFES